MFIRKIRSQKKNTEDIKLLEHKLHLSEINPDPVFDLSDCHLKNLPNGVYSKCRVYRKEKLLLTKNCFKQIPDDSNNKLGEISNTIKYLDLSCNMIEVLNSKLNVWVSLSEIYLAYNQIKNVPQSFSNLCNLELIDISFNRLNKFPEVFCNLKKLNYIDIRGNHEINNVSKQIILLPRLTYFYFDEQNISYPPIEVCYQGLEAIKQFIKDDTVLDEFELNHIQTYNEDEFSKSLVEIDNNRESEKDTFQDYLMRKDLKRKHLLDCEKKLEIDAALFESASKNLFKKRSELIQKMKIGQKVFQEEIKTLQNKKRENKTNLLKTLSMIEVHSKRLIQNIREIQAKDKLRAEMMNKININVNQKLKDQHVASTSESLEKIDLYKFFKKDKFQSKDDEYEEKLQKIFENKQKNKNLIQDDLKLEESLKSQALNILLNEREQQHKIITEQITLIENELFVLTQAEIQKKNQNLGTVMADISQQRITLAFFLGELLEEKEKKFIKQACSSSSTSYDSEESNQCNNKRLKEIYLFDEYLYRLIFSCDFKSILPYLSLLIDQNINFEKLVKMNEKDLQLIGIEDYEVIQMIMNGVKVIVEENLNIATAPELDSIKEKELEPSAPPLIFWYQIECSVCLDLKSDIIFLPCGHICCCQNCSNLIKTCPLCRSAINKRCIAKI